MKQWVSLVASFAYLGLGWLSARLEWEVRQKAARWLTHYVIPPVIAFNIATHGYPTLVLMLAMAGVTALLLMLHHLHDPDPVRSLCFAYLNIGWLGLPVATALLGGEASVILMSAYVGSSVVGNTMGAALFGVRLAAWADWLKRLVAMPACRAALLGLLLMPWGPSLSRHGEIPYHILKTMMSVLGMGVLGAWLAQSRPDRRAFLCALRLFLLRLPAFGAAFGLLFLLSLGLGVNVPPDLAPSLLLLCLLPPAANIVVLETHYLQAGHSAPVIAAGTAISLASIGGYALILRALQSSL